MKRILLSISFLIACFIVQAQDLHFSQFNWSYLNLNPALTGQFNGDYRFNANFKNQWSSIAEPYQTFAFAADANRPIDSYKPLNMGFVFYNDDAGVGGLQTTQASLSLSHGFGLNVDSSLQVSVGTQIGLLSRSINFDVFSFDNQFNGARFNSDRPTGEDFDNNSLNHLLVNAGVAFNYLYENRKTFNFGVALFNLTGGNRSFQGTAASVDERLTIHGGADYFLSQKIDLLPSFIFSSQGPNRELLFGTNLRYRLSESSFFKRNIYGGVWYRNKDALILSTGLDYNQWLVGVSYDINLSNLEIASNNRGGLELSLTYIIKEFKPKIRRFKICPKYL